MPEKGPSDSAQFMGLPEAIWVFYILSLMSYPLVLNISPTLRTSCNFISQYVSRVLKVNPPPMPGQQGNLLFYLSVDILS